MHDVSNGGMSHFYESVYRNILACYIDDVSDILLIGAVASFSRFMMLAPREALHTIHLFVV